MRFEPRNANSLFTVTREEIETELGAMTIHSPRMLPSEIAPSEVAAAILELNSPIATPALITPQYQAVPEAVTVDLAAELAPLFEFLNRPCTPRRPMIVTSPPAVSLPEYRRGTRTRFSPNVVEVTVDPHDYLTYGQRLRPEGSRRQLLLTLLANGTVDPQNNRLGRRVPIAERRRGSLRAPIVFELHVSGHMFDPSQAFWNFRLSASCLENDRVSAVRNQVRLLIELLRDPERAVPLSEAAAFLPSTFDRLSGLDARFG